MLRQNQATQNQDIWDDLGRGGKFQRLGEEHPPGLARSRSGGGLGSARTMDDLMREIRKTGDEG